MMKAAVFRKPGHIEVTEIDRPVAGPGDVLVRVRAASICGTDLRIMQHGHFRIEPGQSRVLGHEVAGEIVEVGGDVSGWSVGGRVGVTPNVGCGRCRQCRAGLNQMCSTYDAFGITIDGGFQEYMLVPAWALERDNLSRLPDGMPYEIAALVEPMSCCLSGQRKVDLKASDSVLIIGAGPIGCFHAVLAKLRGSQQVMVANTRRTRLEIAGVLGADELIAVGEVDLHARVMELTEGEGADVVITCVSKPEVIESVTGLMARNGRANVFSGLGKSEHPRIDVNALHYRAQTLTGTTGSSIQDYRDTLEIIDTSGVDLSPIISRRFRLDEIEDAMEHSRSGQGMKSIILFEGESS
jgi:threonine dehydrogenase-like Zn-dependent dehydrogenase